MKDSDRIEHDIFHIIDRKKSLNGQTNFLLKGQLKLQLYILGEVPPIY